MVLLAVAFVGCAANPITPPNTGDGEPDAGPAAPDGGDATRDGGHVSWDMWDAATPEPEVCDGVDNDRNGVIDDLDVGGDGICDCLRIATLGVPGTWGEGDVFAEWLDTRSDTGATDLGDTILTDELLAPFQVLVAQDLRGREYSDEEVEALRRWIEAGGGLMTLIGYGPDTLERTNVNQLLAPSGIQYGEEHILPGTRTVPVTTWHEHPVSEAVTRIGVNSGYPVTGASDVVAEEGGYVLLRVTTLGAGHVLVWGDEWITYDSEWTDHPEYQVERFWLNAIKWLSPATECQVPILI